MNLESTLLAIELYDCVPFSIVQIAEATLQIRKNWWKSRTFMSPSASGEAGLTTRHRVTVSGNILQHTHTLNMASTAIHF